MQQVWWWPLVAVCVVAVGLLGMGHGRYGLFDVDEAIFSQASREMLASQQLSMPTYNGDPRYHKPPLVYWAQGALMTGLGEDNVWAARLPSVLSALATVALLGWWVTTLWGWRMGLMAAGMLVTSLSFVVIGRAATADGLLNFFSLALVVSGLRQVYGGGRWWVTGVLAGLGLLAKGPVAWLPALLVLGTLLLVRKRPWQTVWAKVQPWRTLAVALVVLLPWLVLMWAQGGWGFFYEFFWVHNFARYGAGFGNTQSDSVLYYGVVLLVGLLPWVLLLPRAVRWCVTGWWARVRSDELRTALPALVLVWGVGYVVFFSMSATKLAHYIVPAYPALILLVVGHLHAAHSGRLAGHAAQWLGAVWLLLLGAVLLLLNGALAGLAQPILGGWVALVQQLTDFEWPPGDPLAWAVLTQQVEIDAATTFAGVVMLLCVVPAWWLVARGRRDVLSALGFSWAVVLGLVVWGTVPTVWRYTQGALHALALDIKALPAGTEVVHLGLHKPSVRYDSQRAFMKLEKAIQVPGYLDAAVGDEVAVLTEWPTVAEIEEVVGAQEGWHVGKVWCKGGYCVMKIGRRAML